MTVSHNRILAAPGQAAPSGTRARRLLPSTRYRHPGDVIRLIAAGLALIGLLAGLMIAGARSTATGPFTMIILRPGSPAASMLTDLVQAAFAVAALAVVAITLAHRRYRLLAGLTAGVAAAGTLTVTLTWLTGGRHAGLHLAAAASAVAAMFAAAPWLSRAWRRSAMIALLLAGAALLIAGMVPLAGLALAVAAGATAGAGTLILFGVPDSRLGPEQIAAELSAAGVPVAWVEAASVEATGSRPFFAATADGQQLFVKVLGSDQRDADLLYRAYRFIRLRGVGDAMPAASLAQAVEHEALVTIMAERAGVRGAAIRQVIRAGDGSVLLTMDRIDGVPLDRLQPRQLSGALLRALWAEVARLHRAGIAHRALRAANIMIDRADQPRLVDFSFAAIAATERQQALDVAELLASLAVLAGADAAVTSAVEGAGCGSVAAAVPLLQPPALSAATRRAIAAHSQLLTSTRTTAAAAGGLTAEKLARLQRVRPRTLVMIAVLAGAFYFLLPQLAQVGSSWQAIRSVDWAWVPVVAAFSVLTYLAAAVSIMGAVPRRIRLWPTLLAQTAASFFNRVSPANVGGMAMNVRYLQKCGVDTGAGVAAVGVTSAVGAVVHLVLIAVFFAWSGRSLARVLTLPAGGRILLVAAAVIAVAGIALASRPGRRFATAKVVPWLRSGAVSLGRVAGEPVKMIMLFGGSALVTLAYIGALAASVTAFGGGPGIAVTGAVYLGASAIAAAAPTPGGLGAIEAALVAGLAGVGMPSGPAVAAVLLYRLATYWLPIVPGWLSWRLLQHQGYL